MELTTAIQESLLALMCYDREHASVTKELVHARVFDSVYRRIAEKVINYLDAHKEPPGDHTIDVFDDVKRDDEQRAPLYDRVYDSLQVTKDEVNPDYVLGKAQAFVRFQTLKRAVADVLDSLEKGTEEAVEEAERILDSARVATTDLFDPGVWALRDIKATLAFLDEAQHAFPTGIRELDKRGIGPKVGTLNLFIAPPGRGKSWWLLHLARQARAHGKRVLYISLEMSRSEVCGRIVQATLGLAKRDVGQLSWIKFENTRGGEVAWSKKVKRRVRHLEQRGIREKVIKKLPALARAASILVRDFPSGSLTVDRLGAFLELLETRQGFRPDLVLLDYADLMKFATGDEHRIALGQLYVDLRGLAQTRGFALATASQANREGAKARRVMATHAAEDYSKIATADVVLTYSQTPLEKRLGLARVYVDKARTEEDKIEVVVSQRYQTGHFAVSSTFAGSDYEDRLDGHSESSD